MKKKYSFLYGSSIYIGLTPIFSVFFSVIGLPMPSYLLASLVTISLVAYSFSENGKFDFYKIQALLIFFVLGIIVYVLSYLLGRDSAAADNKSINMLYVVVAPIILFALALFLTKAECPVASVNRIYSRVFFFSTVALLFSFFLFKIPETEGRYVLPGLDNPIWVSRHLAACLLVYFVSKYSAKRKMSTRQVLFAAAIFGALIISGSRGPLIAVVISLLLYLYGRRELSFGGLFASIVATSLIMLVLGIFTASYVFDTEFYSVYHRFDATSFAIDQPISFFGKGISSFGYYYLGEDVDIYPHNLLAELYFEIGVVGVLLFLVITWAISRVFAHSIPGLLALFYYINAMSSGDIPGNAPLFLSLFVACVVYKSTNLKIKKQESEI